MYMRRKLFVLSWLLLLPLGIGLPLFGQPSLTLEQCREMALERNKKIQMAQTEKQEAVLARKAAQTYYLPKIDFGGGYLRTGSSIRLLESDLFLPVVPYNAIDAETGGLSSTALQDPSIAAKTLVINSQTGQPVTDASGNPVFQQYAMIPADNLVLDKKNIYYAGFNLTQPLFTGLKITEANRLAKSAEHISEKNLMLTQSEILVSTDKAFWRVVSLQEKVKLAHSYAKLLDRLVTDLNNMYAEGVITRNNLLTAQVKQNESKLKSLEAENGLALSKMALAQIIGMEDSLIDVVAGNLETTDLVTGFVSTGIVSPDNRVEVKMLEEKVNMMESGKNIARSKFMPDIALAGHYGWMNPNPYNGFKEEFGGDWSVGVVVKIPVFTWGERVHELNAAKLKQNKAQLELDEAKEMIDLQIRQCKYKYEEALKKVEMTKLSVEQAEENMRITKDNLSEGRSRLSELLEAQTEWESASSAHIDALAEVKTAKLELDKATGDIYHYFPEEK